MMPGFGPIMRALMLRRRGMPMVNPPMMDEDLVRQPPMGGPSGMGPDMEMAFPQTDMDYEQQESRLAQPQLVHSREEAGQIFGTPRGKPLPPGVEAYTRGMEKYAPHRGDPMMGRLYDRLHGKQESAIKSRLREQVGLEKRHELGDIDEMATNEQVEEMRQMLEAIKRLRGERGAPKK